MTYQLLLAVDKDAQTILVVEDEAANLRLISLFLGKQGYRVLQARDGLEAMDLLAQSELILSCVISECPGWMV